MSTQNRKTVEAYQKNAKRYIASVNKIDAASREKANAKLHRFLKENLELVPKSGKVLEVGSANGELSSYIEGLGYEVTASDVADDFIAEIAKTGLKPLKFNILEDEFNQKYHCVVCWKVFVHFTEKDMLDALMKTYGSLKENGLLVFNIISDETKNIKEQWIDFPGEYSIGIDRYFRYYSRGEVEKIIAKTDFEILDLHKETGVERAKWLVCVLRKGRK